MIQIAINAKHGGIHKCCLRCLEYPVSPMHMSKDMQLWMYAHHSIEQLLTARMHAGIRSGIEDAVWGP